MQIQTYLYSPTSTNTLGLNLKILLFSYIQGAPFKFTGSMYYEPVNLNGAPCIRFIFKVPQNDHHVALCLRGRKWKRVTKELKLGD